jgi:hypothetical protein
LVSLYIAGRRRGRRRRWRRERMWDLDFYILSVGREQHDNM